MTISENRTASGPHRVPAMVVAVWLTDALTGRTATTVIKPPEPESKLKMFEKSRGAAASSPPESRRGRPAAVGGLSPPTYWRATPPRRAGQCDGAPFKS